jgi:hypothetical protein
MLKKTSIGKEQVSSARATAGPGKREGRACMCMGVVGMALGGWQ